MRLPPALFAALAVALPLGAAASPVVSVARTAGCGCCAAWVEYLRDAGFAVEAQDVAPDALTRLKADLGIGPALASCHTAQVEGYVIEGHVPAEDVRRLLAERPDAVGLAVPGMPIGAPGMEMGDRRDAYDVLLVGRDGETTTFSSRR